MRGDTSLDRLHEIIQIVMGWTDSHLHQFIVGETYFGPPEIEADDLPMSDETKARLNQVAGEEGSGLLYEYDFGDSWLHELLVEQIAPPEPGIRYPVCIAGERACPPEDVGSIPGYEDFLEAMGDPDHPEHEDYVEWIGGEFDPEVFDCDQVNELLRHPEQWRYG